MTISSDEPELRALMLAGLDGDEASHKSLLTKLSAYLRAYFKGQLARIGRGPSDAEDLVQETLIALHTRRHTYDRSQLLTPWVMRSPVIGWSTTCGGPSRRTWMYQSKRLKGYSPMTMSPPSIVGST